MSELEDQLDKVFENYYKLMKLSPENELLRYYLLDFKEGFRKNPDEIILTEFMSRFRGGFPSPDVFMKENPEESIMEYGRELTYIVLHNYAAALKKEKDYIEKTLQN